MMCLVVLMLMTILAAGSCMKCEEVNVGLIEGSNATLHYATSGVTIFYEIDCKTGKSRWIGQYCGPNQNCTTSWKKPIVSIEPGRLILNNVTSNKSYRAKPIPGEKQGNDVTAKKPLNSTISPEISNSKFSTATPLYNSTSTSSPEISNSKFSTATPSNSSTSDSPGASKHIGAIAAVVVVVGGGGGVAGGCYICIICKKSKRRNGQVNSVV